MSEETQARYYRRALELAFCQPNVTGMLFFHSHDEPALSAWQSGVYYVDGTPKSSLNAVRTALGATRGGSVARCPGMSLTVKPALAFDTRKLSFRLRCDLDCVYRARLIKLPKRSTTSARSGRLVKDAPLTVSLARKLRPGSYRITVTVTHPVNPGRPVVRESRVVTVR